MFLFVLVLRYALFALVPLSFLSTFYLYLYPVFHFCAFPSTDRHASTAYTNTLLQHTPFAPSKVAPFRLLALGDPQLEGESSIPFKDSVHLPNYQSFLRDAFLRDGTQHSPLERIRHSLHDLVDLIFEDLPRAFEVYRKRVDHVGNDYYLGHIYRTLHWWTNPTHVTVLGDLVGSQWIDDEEFESRGRRYWDRVFRGGARVDDQLAAQPSEDFKGTHVLGVDAEGWKKRIINVAGNHDIGYAGDLSPERLERFERVFGKANYELRFQLPTGFAKNISGKPHDDLSTESTKEVPEVRIVLLNDMNLDTPASSSQLQDETYQFLNTVITTSHAVTRPALFTIVLTHIPMYKPEGVCVDGPLFNYFDGEFDNGISEQNHLSLDASKGILQGIFGMSGDAKVEGKGLGRKGIVLTGHDHEGCDVYHYINQSTAAENREWEVTRHAMAREIIAEGKTEGVPGLREVTLRSMMGDFNGNAGLLSLWFNDQTWEWEFELQNCEMGTQHGWWVVHILDLVTIIGVIIYGFLSLTLSIFAPRNPGKRPKKMSGNLSASMRPRKKKSRKLLSGHPGGGNLGGEVDATIEEE